MSDAGERAPKRADLAHLDLSLESQLALFAWYVAHRRRHRRNPVLGRLQLGDGGGEYRGSSASPATKCGIIVYKELQQTIHFKNRSGVRAKCSDCHVPHEWFYKVRRKIQASNELLHKVLGTVNTPEKFEQHRLELAERVWATMKANDSHECRNCHSAEAMDPHKQTEAAAKVMAEGFKAGLTCIDCHKGIAHKLPKMPDEDEEPSKKQ